MDAECEGKHGSGELEAGPKGSEQGGSDVRGAGVGGPEATP